MFIKNPYLSHGQLNMNIIQPINERKANQLVMLGNLRGGNMGGSDRLGNGSKQN